MMQVIQTVLHNSYVKAFDEFNKMNAQNFALKFVLEFSSSRFSPCRTMFIFIECNNTCTCLVVVQSVGDITLIIFRNAS